MEPMDVEIYSSDLKISATRFNNNECILIDKNYTIHCTRQRPFNLCIEDDSFITNPRLLVLGLVNSKNRLELVERCKKHTSTDRMSKSSIKPCPLVIHEDISPRYKYGYTENGCAIVLLPAYEKYIEFPVILKCSSECMKKEISLIIHSSRTDKEGVPIRLVHLNIYSNIRKFREGVKNVAAIAAKETELLRLRSVTLEFDTGALAEETVKTLIQSLQHSVEKQIPCNT